MGQLYRSVLARFHQEHTSALASSAASEALGRMPPSRRAGRAVDLACGSGEASGVLCEAGFEVLGVDLSDDMCRLARRQAPQADIVKVSLWTTPLPKSALILAVGEAFCYRCAGCTPDMNMLAQRLMDIFAALESGGLLLFDVATPARSGPSGKRVVTWNAEPSTFLAMTEQQTPENTGLTRTIDTFVRTGELYARDTEQHFLTVFEPDEIDRLLSSVGFIAERLHSYREVRLMPGWGAWAARKP